MSHSDPLRYCSTGLIVSVPLCSTVSWYLFQAIVTVLPEQPSTLALLNYVWHQDRASTISRAQRTLLWRVHTQVSRMDTGRDQRAKKPDSKTVFKSITTNREGSRPVRVISSRYSITYVATKLTFIEFILWLFRKLILLKNSIRNFILFSSFYTSAKQVLEMLHTCPKDALMFGQRDIFSPLFIILLEPLGKDTWINSLYTIIYSLNHPTRKSKNSWPEWAEPGILRNVLCICTSYEQHAAEADTHTHFLPCLFLLWAPWLHEKNSNNKLLVELVCWEPSWRYTFCSILSTCGERCLTRLSMGHLSGR